jgi:hypothetical protein
VFGPSVSANHNDHFQLVNDMGNPWVILAVPIPLPTLYPYPLHGYGFCHGFAKVNPWDTVIHHWTIHHH